MPIWRLNVEAAADSLLPRDAITITPHFNDGGVSSDPQGLCDDLCAAMATYYNGGRQIEVTAYDAQGTPPVVPQGYAIANLGTAPPADQPREVACCLSFYSEFNRPRLRGRLYICAALTQSAASTSGRPSLGMRTKVGQLAPILQDLGGLDVDWCVYSRVDNEARAVTNWWVDDEWDTIRSRGLRGTTRLLGTTSEG